MIKIFAVMCALCMTSTASAQGWPNERVAEMLVRTLSPTGAMESGQWFVSSDVLRNGTIGLGVIYAHVPGSAGTVSIHAGIYHWTDAGWRAHQQVEGLFGYSPRNAQFSAGRATLTTTTLGPEDARCCPTLETQWAIDLATGAVVRQN